MRRVVVQCVQAATSLVKLMVEDFVPTGFVRYFPELIYVHSAFAAVVLMKVRSYRTVYIQCTSH